MIDRPELGAVSPSPVSLDNSSNIRNSSITALACLQPKISDPIYKELGVLLNGTTKLVGKSTDEIIAMADEIINKPEWTYNYKWSSDYSEELTLVQMMRHLSDKDEKGPELVRLGMDIITADLEHGQEVNKVFSEARYLKKFPEGDEQLTQTVNDFLEEKRFNKEN